MAFLKTLILALPLFLLFSIHKVVSQGETTTFTYNTFSTTTKSLTYQVDAFVPPSSSFLRLTKTDDSGVAERDSIGRVVYTPPINFWDEGLQASFETTIKFIVKPGYPGQTGGIGDGVNFFIAPVDYPIPPGSVNGDLGLFDHDTGLAPSVFAVEFDFAPNVVWDPVYKHIGIDINSRESKAITLLEDSVGKEVTARINYVSSTRTITVTATYGGTNNSTLSYVFDLKTILPKQVQVGISATTGSWTAIQDLHTWYFSSTLVWDSNNDVDKTYIRQYV